MPRAHGAARRASQKAGSRVKEESLPALAPESRNGAHAVPAGKTGPLAVKCPGCKELLFHRDLEKNLDVCPRCDHHFRLGADRRIEQIADEGTFEDLTPGLRSADPLRFVSRSQSYRDKLESERAATGLNAGVVTGRATIEGLPAVITVMDFHFIGGSMASVEGEIITQSIERAAEEGVPLIIFSASGGARMQEGFISLMQMAKTSAALARLNQAGVPYISVLTDPTTGGVAASFASLGDIILAEPKALVGFAGPRVIEQFMHQRLPKDTNTSEFVLLHGMIDAVVPRRALRSTLARLLRMYAAAGTRA
jgi:acetyl-CoA carboxylase carboxyl transferase subunit beta